MVLDVGQTFLFLALLFLKLMIFFEEVGGLFGENVMTVFFVIKTHVSQVFVIVEACKIWRRCLLAVLES